MRVVHLEHTSGHDKFYRVATDRSTALIRFGRRGTPGQVLVESRAVAVQRIDAKLAKGYDLCFEASLPLAAGTVDALAGRPDRGTALAISAAADAAWATELAGGGAGCVVVIDGQERSLAAMPHLEALTRLPSARFVPAGTRAALALSNGVSAHVRVALARAGVACLGVADGWCDAPAEVLRAGAGIADGKLPLDEVLAAAAAV